MRKALGITAIFLALMVIACTSSEEHQERRTAALILSAMNCRPSSSIVMFSSGEVEGGIGVVVEDGNTPAAIDALVYWIQGDKIFAVNAAAKTCSPDVPEAPENITSGKILAVAD